MSGTEAEVRIDNARDPEQERRMRLLAETGQCHFCGDISGKHTAPIIFQNLRWFVVANDFPYEGSVHHYLIVSKAHAKKISDLFLEAQVDLFEAIRWLEAHLNVTGYSMFVRSGDMSYTSATLDHLHIHFLVGVEKPNPGEKDKPETVIFAPLGYKKQE